MKTRLFRDDNCSNFGDELSPWMWDRLFDKERFEAAPGLLFGIGTLLWGELPPERPIVVFGSGAGYGPAPSLDGVDVRFVRGPRTAKVIGKPHRWITDPAILLADMVKQQGKTYDVSFMPHWTTAAADPTITARLADLGITTIDPTKPVDTVLDMISKSKLVLSEALHGAVVADALRIPWVAATLSHGHSFKWFDWCESLNLPYDPVDLNIVSVKWAIDNSFPLLSQDRIHRSRLFEVRRELAILKDDLCL